ncbi:hypothetical protein PAECIP111894_02776 [Paenibacillus pseudetheri]|uniref:Transposase n=1 Tax=Paenibacillus pseudetheri TaxID=2897682 RepID=A0ABM9BDT0_9BACL|nr:hypothetical protein PAECIP111894_02776 [Paenibacillus pseudetheri]
MTRYSADEKTQAVMRYKKIKELENHRKIHSGTLSLQ